MTNRHHKSLRATALQNLAARIELQGTAGNYLYRGELNIKKIAQECEIPPRALRYDPELRPIILTIRGLVLKHAKPKTSAASPTDRHEAKLLVERVTKTGVVTRTQLAASDGDLYDTVCGHTCKEIIFQEANLPNKHGGRWQDSDADIIAQCKFYDSLSDLKFRNTALHNEVKGRQIEQAVVEAYGWYTFDYVGLENRHYRSRMELVVGNLLVANGVAFQYAPIVPGVRPRGSKPYRSDFQLLANGLYLELLQNGVTAEQTRGILRREAYARSLESKKLHYRNNRLRVEYINTEPFSAHDREFCLARYVVNRLLKYGLELHIPAREILLSNAKLSFFSMTVDEVLDGPLANCLGIGMFDNSMSSIKNRLRQHPDYLEIRARLKTRGLLRRRAAVSSWRRTQESRYLKYSKAAAFVKRLGFKTSVEWRQYVYHGIPGLHPLPETLPKNPYVVYRRIGGWINWAHWLGTERC